MFIVELPLPSAARNVVFAVRDDVVVTDVVARASTVDVDTIPCVVLHPVAGDDVVVCIVEVDAAVVQVCYVIRQCVAVRIVQSDTMVVVRVRGVALQCVAV